MPACPQYTCGEGAGSTCTDPRYITATTATNYTYIGGDITLGKSQNNYQLQDTITVKKIDLALNPDNYADYVFGDTEYLDRDSFAHTAVTSITYSLLGGNLELSFAGLLNLTDLDSVIKAKVSYSLTDQLIFGISGYFFNEGIEEGSYGAYKDLSCLVLKGSFSF